MDLHEFTVTSSTQTKAAPLTTITISKRANIGLVNAGLNANNITAHGFKYSSGSLALLNGEVLK